MPNAIFFYRISRWLYVKNIPILPKFFQAIIFLLYNSKVPPTADIGAGTFLVVKGIGVVVIDRAVIGKDCRIGIGCKIVGKGPFKEVPRVGNRVFLGPGSVIVGPIKIDDDVIVAANSVVNKSVPKGAIVAGAPARIIGWTHELKYDVLANSSYKEGFSEYLKEK